MTDNEKMALKILGTVSGLVVSGGIVAYIGKAASRRGMIQYLPSAVARLMFIQELKKHIGEPYIWGAEGPNQFDCSGLVNYCYKQIGIDVPRLVTEQAGEAPHVVVFDTYKTPSELVEDGVLKIGDCLGMDYNPGGRYDHVIVYAGKGDFIQATGGSSCPAGGSRCKVVIDPASHFTAGNVRSVYSYV